MKINNTEKICLIYQPAGIGDVFYSIGIARYYQKLGYRIIWPVVKEILEMVKQIPNIEFYNWEDDFPKKEYYKDNNLKVIHTEEFVFLPIYKSTDIINELTMPSKYKITKASLEYSNWSLFFNWDRNYKKENELYYDILQLTDNEPYILVNQNFITPPRTTYFPINIEQSEVKIISMDYINGYNVLDWSKILENANGIITIDTCIQYMIEKLNTKAEFYYCYLRNGIDTHHQIKDLFKTPWVYLDNNNNIIT